MLKVLYVATVSVLLWLLLFAAGIVAFTAWPAGAAGWEHNCKPAFATKDWLASIDAVEMWIGTDTTSGNSLVIYIKTDGQWAAYVRQDDMLCGAFSGHIWQPGAGPRALQGDPS